MTNRSTGTDYEIWRRISSCIKICEKSCFIQSTRINSFSYHSLESSDDLILSTIGDREYSGHLFSSFGFFSSVKEETTDIGRHETEITDYIESNRISYEFFYKFWNFITEKLEYTSNL